MPRKKTRVDPQFGLSQFGVDLGGFGAQSAEWRDMETRVGMSTAPISAISPNLETIQSALQFIQTRKKLRAGISMTLLPDTISAIAWLSDHYQVTRGVIVDAVCRRIVELHRKAELAGTDPQMISPHSPKLRGKGKHVEVSSSSSSSLPPGITQEDAADVHDDYWEEDRGDE